MAARPALTEEVIRVALPRAEASRRAADAVGAAPQVSLYEPGAPPPAAQQPAVNALR